MPSISRRNLLAGLALSPFVRPLHQESEPDTARDDSSGATEAKPVPVLHCTDLFRPFADPDDHFDLATIFALLQAGHLDLRTILIDYPPPKHNGDPDVQAVAQMNAITGRAVPVVVGSPRPYDGSRVVRSADPVRDLAGAPGARAILDTLRASPSPVVINIAGSSRDVAIAGRSDPSLFNRKCAAVYLNAGSGTRDPELARRLEYNVQLDPASYAAIFALPCPVYWVPCFEAGPHANGEGATAGPHASLFSFTQKDVLPLLSDRLQNYFTFAYRQGERSRAFEEKVPRANWLHALDGKRDDDSLGAWGALPREMWGTAGLLHAAGLGVRSDGSLVRQRDSDASIFTFDRVRVECSAEGVTSWEPGRRTPVRFILTVRDTERYPAAMTAALLGLLRTLV
jgi:hypothetical protein